VRNGVLWDSSAILALIDASEARHELAVKTARGALRKTRPFITNYIVAEAHGLLVTRVGRAIARQWLLQGGLEVVRATEEEEAAARQLVVEHSDKDWSLCDAISFAVIEGRHARGAFTFDRHFRERNRFEVFGLPK
jgi:predicted nucleic acid-binding protein